MVTTNQLCVFCGLFALLVGILMIFVKEKEETVEIRKE